MIILRQKNNSRRDDIIANYINERVSASENGGTIIPRKWSKNGKERSKNRKTGTVIIPKPKAEEEASLFNRLFKREKAFTYEEDGLEAYEELDPKKISKLTDNQKRMLLEDERKKARRNRDRIVSKYGREGAKKGREEGKKKGTKHGAIVGGIMGAGVGGFLGHGFGYNENDESKKNLRNAGIGALIGAGIGAGGGALIGRAEGAESGAREGKSKGEAKGRRIAKEQGHDDIDRTTKNARAFDDYARSHKGKGKDDWEIGFREQLKAEKKERSEAAERKRQADLEKRRVRAEEERAKADRDRARAEQERAKTDRSRYYDEHFGWGQYSNDKHHRDDDDFYYKF